MLKKNSKQEDLDDYLSEFQQKIAVQKEEILEERRQDLHRARNGFIGTLAGVVLASVIGWILLTPQFSNFDTGEIPVIRRPAAPVKIQPNDPGGMEILNQDKSIYNLVEKKESETVKVESLLPQPEAPKMPTIVPEAEEDKAAEDIQDIAKDANVLEEKALEELIEEVRTNSEDKIQIPTKKEDLNLTVKTVEPAPVKAEIKPTPVKPETKSAGKEIWQVQLMASGNKDAVEKGWQNLSKKHSQLSSLQHEIETAETDAKTVVYRLKVGSFAARSEADKLCEQLKSAGSGCLVKKK